MGLAKKFIWVFLNILQKNPNELFGKHVSTALRRARDPMAIWKGYGVVVAVLAMEACYMSKYLAGGSLLP